MDIANKNNTDLKLSRSEILDILDDIISRISWLEGIASLIMSKCEQSHPNDSVCLSKEDLGNIGSLINHHLKEVENTINKLYSGGIINATDK